MRKKERSARRPTQRPSLPSHPITVHLIHDEADDYAARIKQRAPHIGVKILDAEHATKAELAEMEILLVARCAPTLLAEAKRLRWLQCTNAGVDFLIPLREALAEVAVTNARGIHGDVMADYAMGTIIMHVWDMAGLLRDQAQRRWQPKFVPALAGKTMLVVGLGAIGEVVARRAKAAGMQVIGVKRTGSPEPNPDADEVHGVDRLMALLPRADFVVLVVPSTPQTQAMIGRRELAAMKSGAFLVNMARGNIVEEKALVEALATRQIGGAALDVFEQEPLPKDHPFWSMPNVLVTPHIAGNPICYNGLVSEIFFDNLGRYLSGLPLRNRVDLARGY
jgi:phosphoglycerate dehydrogenase-like enzyme